MKKKTKIVLTAATLATFSLTITAYQQKSQMPPSQPDVRPVSAPVDSSRDSTLPIEDKAAVTEQSPESSTQSEDFSEPIVTEITPLQPTEKEETANTSDIPIQTVTKSTVSPASPSAEPQMGDTRTVDGQKHVYFLGFGWVDDMGENEVIYCEGMYENGNKIGSMGGGTFVDGDGDINKMIGIMD
mgnify:CR=1 FL=1